MAKSFEELIVWQKAHKFVLEIYKETENYPKSEIFGLISQMRRASVSIPANIAEGFRKISNKEKIRYYNISQGSLEEVKYYLILAKDLQYLINEDLRLQLTEVEKILAGYIRSIKQNS